MHAQMCICEGIQPGGSGGMVPQGKFEFLRLYQVVSNLDHSRLILTLTQVEPSLDRKIDR